MIIRKLFIASVVLISMLTLSCCQSKEERVISRMVTLCEELESAEVFDKEVFEQCKTGITEIRDEAKECDFTPQQQARIMRYSGRLISDVATKVPMTMMSPDGRGSFAVRDIARIVNSMTVGFKPKYRKSSKEEFDLSNIDLEEANKELDDAFNISNDY